MHVRVTGAVIVALSVLTFNGCTQVSEPWDTTGYYEQERTHFSELQKPLRDRLRHSQIDA